MYSNALSSVNFHKDRSFRFSNKFIKKMWKTRKTFHFRSISLKNTLVPVYSIINYVKSWDVNLCLFISENITFNFLRHHLNHLKNIFLKCFGQVRLWVEIKKMFNSGFLNFSFATVYWGRDVFCFSLLARFLLELYFSELDNYILSLSLNTNYVYKLISKCKEVEHSVYFGLLFGSLPIKLERNLIIYKNISNVNILRFNNFSNHFLCNSIPKFFSNFKRNFYWVRHINFILFGFLSSKNYAQFIYERVRSFIRSYLMFDFRKDKANFYFHTGFYFLGFSIFIKKKFYPLTSNTNIDKFKLIEIYRGRVKFRVNSYRKKILNSIVSRSNSELFLIFISYMKQKKLPLFSFKSKKVWSFIFQQECLKSLQYGKLLFTNDTIDLPDYALSSYIKSPNLGRLVFYRQYSFNLYIRKLQFVFKELISFTKVFFPSSILPIDLMLHKYVNLLNKKIYFIYENLHFNVFPISSFLKNDSSYLYSSTIRKKFHFIKVWHVSVPKDFIFRKLRTWGFVHPYKNRPISNSRFLLKDDTFILKEFSHFLNKFLLWFGYCDSFSYLKFLTELIRQSCFLTLCRKHNKSKSWAYSVFTPNLRLNKSFLPMDYLFPSRDFNFNLNKKFLIHKSFFSYDEKFFLVNFNLP